MHSDSHQPTGVDFLDESLANGQQLGCVYGLLGPKGVGKTTIGCMIAAEGAQQVANCEGNDSGHSVWVYVSIDEAARPIYDRMFSHAAQLPRDVANSLNFAPAAHDPEMRWSPSAGRKPLSPQAIAALDAVMDHVVVVDLVHHSEPERNDPVDVILEQIRETLRPGMRVAGVVIDYAGLAVSRYCRKGIVSGGGLSRMLQQFVEQCRARLAVGFACPVWLIHQLNSSANQKGVLAPQHQEAAAGCSKFADGTDACFVMGTNDPKCGVFYLCRTKPGAGEKVLLRVDERCASVVKAHNYRVDAQSRSIVPRDRPAVQMDDATRECLRRRLGLTD